MVKLDTREGLFRQGGMHNAQCTATKLTTEISVAVVDSAQQKATVDKKMFEVLVDGRWVVTDVIGIRQSNLVRYKWILYNCTKVELRDNGTSLRVSLHSVDGNKFMLVTREPHDPNRFWSGDNEIALPVNF